MNPSLKGAEISLSLIIVILPTAVSLYTIVCALLSLLSLQTRVNQASGKGESLHPFHCIRKLLLISSPCHFLNHSCNDV